MQSLSKFFDAEIENSKKETTLIFDTHNLVFRTLHIANYTYLQSWSKKTGEVGDIDKKEMTEEEMYSYWKYLMVNSIFSAIKNFTPDRLIMATDGGKGSWRKDVYSQYKANRKVSRDKSTIDFQKFFPILDSFLEDLKKTFSNVYFIRLERIEGDDIIGVLVNEILMGEQITVISSDKDLVQLLKHKNVKQFDPIKKSFIKSINPQKDLLLKIIRGDNSDNIPAIKKRCGPSTAQKMISDGLEIHLVNDEIKSNFTRNLQLIDLNMIPLEIKESIKNEWNTCSSNIKPYDGNKVFNFLVKNKINRFIDDLQGVYGPLLKKLK